MQMFDPFIKCFIHGRLYFGNSRACAQFPSVTVYLGPNTDRFPDVFQNLGLICAPKKPCSQE